MNEIARTLAGEYAGALRAFLGGAGERALQQAYELGRRALGAGVGVLELAAVHQDAMSEVTDGGVLRGGDNERAAEFFAESLAPFEMNQRALREAAIARAQEDERRRIAAEIHDDSVQAMVAVGLRLEMLRAQVRDASLGEALTKLEESVALATGRLRRLLFELRPRHLEREGLVASLRLYLEQIAQETGLECQLEHQIEVEPGLEPRLAIYRIAQEVLKNVRKHARARTVEVSVESTEQGVLARISDDGIGFLPDQADVPGHLGLTAIRDRAELAGGWSRVKSSPGRGASVEFWIPLRREGEPHA